MTVGVGDEGIAVEGGDRPVHRRIGGEAGLQGKDMVAEVVEALFDRVEAGTGAEEGEPRRPDVGGDEKAFGCGFEDNVEEIAGVEAEDGAAALALFRVQPFNLVITDIIMPEMEGIEIITTMKREQPNIRILAMSGGGRARVMDFLAVAGKAGADATLEKPFRKSELLDRVAGLLGT